GAGGPPGGGGRPRPPPQSSRDLSPMSGVQAATAGIDHSMRVTSDGRGGPSSPRRDIYDYHRRLSAAGTSVMAWRRLCWVAYGWKVRCDVYLGNGPPQR